jgi:hypothetical protein
VSRSRTQQVSQRLRSCTHVPTTGILGSGLSRCALGRDDGREVESHSTATQSISMSNGPGHDGTWTKMRADTRAVRITPAGRAGFADTLGLDLPQHAHAGAIAGL